MRKGLIAGAIGFLILVGVIFGVGHLSRKMDEARRDTIELVTGIKVEVGGDTLDVVDFNTFTRTATLENGLSVDLSYVLDNGVSFDTIKFDEFAAKSEAMAVPTEWIEEYNDLIEYLRNREK